MINYNSLHKGVYSLNCRGRLIPLDPPVVMGILNATPDSFYDGGRYNETDSALYRAEQILEEGGSIIDVGGFSSRPGATDITPAEELKRVVPVIREIHRRVPDALISVDTFRADVAKHALEAGACMINDISSGDDDPEMIPFAGRAGVPYIAMHKQGRPATMQNDPRYEDVTTDILTYFTQKAQVLKKAGIKDIIIDPGFGFGKTVDHNYSLLGNLHAFHMLDLPVLVGVSRKRMINEVLNIKAANALNGTTVVNTIALMKGAHILRVHDVKEAVEAIKITSKLTDILSRGSNLQG